jgi:hypothetical protein
VDIDEDENVTTAEFTGTGAGFGARAIFVGGLKSVPRTPAFDLSTAQRDLLQDFGACGTPEREVILGSSGPAELNDHGSEAVSQAKVMDPFTKSVFLDPASCSLAPAPKEVQDATAADQDDEEESLQEELAKTPRAQCTAPGSSDTQADPRLPGFSSEVDCGETETTAASNAQATPRELPITVAHASSKVDMRKDAKRGMVVEVTSVAKGIQVGTDLTIDSVVTKAESWANGRKRPDDAKVSADCVTNRARTAGTCYNTTLFGVKMGSFTCGSGGTPCGDEKRAVEELNRRFNPYLRARLRSPDEVLRIGSDNGYQAGIQRPFVEREPDRILNNDFLDAILPGFEIIRGADATTGRGRQIYQFGGVAATSTYGIQLLPTYGDLSLEVKLQDDDEEPLAGGVFELHQDRDGNGVIGVDDPVLSGSACVTEQDGIGTCSFDKVAPGKFVLHQKAAPAGYAPEPDDFGFELAPGDPPQTVVVTNLKAIGSVNLTLTDDSADAKPLPGATFSLHADDGDQRLGAGDKELETCTTDAEGTCEFPTVPLGALVVHESTAPDGYQAAEDIAFELKLSGQVADVAIVNGLAGAGGTEGDSGTPDEPGTPDQVIPEGFVEDTGVDLSEPAPAPEPVVETTPLDPGNSGGPLKRLLSAPGDAARWLVRSPGDAIVFGAVWALLAGAVVLVVRRRSLGRLVGTAGPA